MNKKNKKLKIVITVIIIFALILGSSMYLLLWNNTNDIAYSQSYNLVDELRALQETGGNLELTEGKINSSFNSIFENPIEKYGIVINSSYVKILDNKLTIFASIKYKGMDLLPNITGKIDFANDRLIFTIDSVKLGKMLIPGQLLINKLKEYSNEDIIISKDKIEISKFLLPFKTDNIYLSNNEIIVAIIKSNITKTSSKDVIDSNTQNTQSNNAKVNEKNTKPIESANNSSSHLESDYDKQNNASWQDTQVDTITPKESQVKSLNKVSTQLKGVIANVKTAEEKQMMEKIQTVVLEVAANPNYPYQGDANEVKNWYKGLNIEEKNRVKNAILSNVNLLDILKLINIFGV